MNILLLSFSGRDNGNCNGILKFITHHYDKHSVSSINIKNLNIHGCFNCNYQCFNSSLLCPYINDDIELIYNKIINSDLTIFLVPTYSEAPPSLYFAFRERSQCVFKSDTFYKIYTDVKKAFIVLGNKTSGGLDTVNILLNEEKKYTYESVLLLESHNYNQSSIKCELIKCKTVQNEIINFIDSLI